MTNANQFEGFQGWLIQRLGAFPVNLARPSVSSLRSAINLLEDKRKLVIFPEGGIVRDQSLREFKPGLARLVLQAEASQGLKIPIVPISINYSPEAVARAKISVHIAPALYSEQYRQESDQETAKLLTQALYTSILQGLEAA